MSTETIRLIRNGIHLLMGELHMYLVVVVDAAGILNMVRSGLLYYNELTYLYG